MIIDRIKKIENTKKNAIINMFIKPIGLIISLLSTPLLLKYFNNEQYGLWATLLSITTWINFFDMGLGNGLRNSLSKDILNGDYAKANKSISTTLVTISFIGLVIYIILLASLFLLDWNSILNTSYSINKLFILFFGFVCLNFIFSLSNSILYSLQKPIVVSLKTYVSQIIDLLGIVFISIFTKGNFELIALLYGSSTLITHIVTFIYIYKKYDFLKLKINSIDISMIKSISSLGLKFFAIQICCLIIFSTDNILISHFFGSESVTPFSITDKVFTTMYSFLAALVVPYWSKSTIAFNKKDTKWIKESILFLLKIYIIFVIGYIALLVIFNPLVKIWLGSTVEFDTKLTIIMCIYYCVYSVLTIECQFINGSGKINTQLIIYLIVAALNIPLSIILGVNFKMSTVGIRLATVILLLIETVVLGFDLRNTIKNIELEEKNDNNKKNKKQN